MSIPRSRPRQLPHATPMPADHDPESMTAYLRSYFQPLGQFAAQCAIPRDALNELIDARVIPAPAYTVSSSGELTSVGFGTLGAVDLPEGAYLHPGTRIWALRAHALVQAEGTGAARALVRRHFVDGYCLALGGLDETVTRLPDCFTATGELRQEGAYARAERAWQAFTSGFSAWQTADISRVWSIARLDVLEDALVAFAQRAVRTPPHVVHRARGWLDEYVRAALPLTATEAARCEARRAVRDLHDVLAAQAAHAIPVALALDEAATGRADTPPSIAHGHCVTD